jgi:hypothetical protein
LYTLKCRLFVDVISYRRFFVRIRVAKKKICPFPRQGSYIIIIYYKALIILRRVEKSGLGQPLRNVDLTNDHGYVPKVLDTSWSFPHS